MDTRLWEKSPSHAPAADPRSGSGDRRLSATRPAPDRRRHAVCLLPGALSPVQLTCRRLGHCRPGAASGGRGTPQPRGRAFAAPFRRDIDVAGRRLPARHCRHSPASLDSDDADLREGRRSGVAAHCTTMAGGAAMLTDAVHTYLAIRRATGFALRCEGIQLKSFATFSEARGHQYISSDLALEWAGVAQSVSQRARRLGTIIRFARYLRAEDSRHQVPSPIFGAEKLPRPAPYILTMDQIRQVIDAASRVGYRT